MVKALRTTARVGPGGRVEVTDPALPEGASVEVLVLLPEPTGDGASALVPETPAASPPPGLARLALDAEGLPILPPLDEERPYSLADMIGAAPSGRTAEEVDRELRALRDEWD